VRFTTTDPYSAYLMVEAGLGVSLNQSLTARDWQGGVVVMPLDPPQPVEIGIALPETMSPAACKFADFAADRAHLATN
jgi:DNA-binding transcriptional LysR family regulator